MSSLTVTAYEWGMEAAGKKKQRNCLKNICRIKSMDRKSVLVDFDLLVASYICRTVLGETAFFYFCKWEIIIGNKQC